MQTIQSKVLIIVGMHRSGTSLTAQWINKCGLSLGDRLLGSSPGNKFGHYEDLDFLEFHEDLLKANRLRYDVTVVEDIHVSDAFRNRAKKLIQMKNSQSGQWGWKEPRTSLFLPLWDSLIDNPSYLIVYRSYTEVVDSLLRREYQTIMRRRNPIAKRFRGYQFERNVLSRANHYLKVWIAYNSHILKFLKSQNSEAKILLLENSMLKVRSTEVMKRIIINWGFDLEIIDIKNIFKKGHMKNDVKNLLELDPFLVEKAMAISEEIESYSFKNMEIKPS